jgi:hypothetical protein
LVVLMRVKDVHYSSRFSINGFITINQKLCK